MKLALLSLLLCGNVALSQTTNLLITFEAGTNGGVVTAANLASSSLGNLQGYWTVDPGDGGVTGFPGAASFSTNAQHKMVDCRNVAGSGKQDGSGSLGLITFTSTNYFWLNNYYTFSNQVNKITADLWIYWNITNVANFDISAFHHTTGTGAYNNLLLSCRPTGAYIQVEITGCGTCTDFLTNGTGDSSFLPLNTWYHVVQVFDSTTNVPNMSMVVSDESGTVVGQYSCYQPCNGTLAGYYIPGIHTSSYLVADTNKYVWVDSILLTEGAPTPGCTNTPTASFIGGNLILK